MKVLIVEDDQRLGQQIMDTLEQAGIEFTGDPLVNPGVTLRVNHK